MSLFKIIIHLAAEWNISRRVKFLFGCSRSTVKEIFILNRGLFAVVIVIIIIIIFQFHTKIFFFNQTAKMD